MLVVVQAPFPVEFSPPEWIEDELVRHGARDAHLVDEDIFSVTVSAASPEQAEGFVRELIGRVSAKLAAASRHGRSSV